MLDRAYFPCILPTYLNDQSSMNLSLRILSILLIISASCQTIQPVEVEENRTDSARSTTTANTSPYVTSRTGQLPIILSVPHGGYTTPSTISDRNCTDCVYVRDAWTQELGQAVDSVLTARTGCTIHLVVNLLHRIKMDPNREIVTGADGDPTAEQAWRAYHDALAQAKQTVIQKHGKGLLIDIHGHGHAIQRLELGYLVSGSNLQKNDSQLNALASASSIYNLTKPASGGHTLSSLLRGTYAFGTLLHQGGFPSVPSQTDPYPQTADPYFNGGYITQQYGSSLGGKLDAIQIEHNMTGVRDTKANRIRYAQSLATTLDAYLQRHYFGASITTLCR